jgi:lipopolysaccharide/colanic/teichoic acid biosynthesis glycosyltransferase
MPATLGGTIMYRRYGKRVLDLALTIPALIVLAPVMLIVAVLVRSKLGAPVLFRQPRPGLYGQPFEILKFRTMTDARDSAGNLLPDEQRQHPFGLWLRSTSIDELPELLLVVSGTLSLVGPRPLLMRYLPRYTPEQMRRHDVLPGISGWAQVNGRNALAWEDKFVLDVWYVDHMTFWLDMRIIALTVIQILKRDGISAEGQFSSPEFLGTHTSERVKHMAGAMVTQYEHASPQ